MVSFQHFNEKCDIVQWGAMNTAQKVNCLTTTTQQRCDGPFIHPQHVPG